MVPSLNGLCNQMRSHANSEANHEVRAHCADSCAEMMQVKETQEDMEQVEQTPPVAGCGDHTKSEEAGDMRVVTNGVHLTDAQPAIDGSDALFEDVDNRLRPAVAVAETNKVMPTAIPPAPRLVNVEINPGPAGRSNFRVSIRNHSSTPRINGRDFPRCWPSNNSIPSCSARREHRS